jgi:hypothetical protein
VPEVQSNVNKFRWDEMCAALLAKRVLDISETTVT